MLDLFRQLIIGFVLALQPETPYKRLGNHIQHPHTFICIAPLTVSDFSILKVQMRTIVPVSWK